MQVIFGEQQKNELADKYTVLELDTFYQQGLAEPVTAYAVLGMQDMKIEELPVLDNFTRLHNTMLVEYKKKNWSYCHQALEHLKGRWRGELDSFYEIFGSRIQQLEKEELSPSWDGIIYK